MLGGLDAQIQEIKKAVESINTSLVSFSFLFFSFFFPFFVINVFTVKLN